MTEPPRTYFPCSKNRGSAPTVKKRRIVENRQDSKWFALFLESIDSIMKKLLFAFISCLVMLAGSAQIAAVPQDGELIFPEADYNFGKIPQGKPVYHVFLVRNNSTKPVKLDNVQAACGCTTPEWSGEPIAPGATAKIRVGYNAASEGLFDKTITVTYNGNVSKIIHIKGEVWKAPAGAAPVNAPVQFLKQQTL